MKLALERAMLLAADILLLDEPTNHLDVHNVAWLEQYLISQPNITCITVSHDRWVWEKGFWRGPFRGQGLIWCNDPLRV